MAVTHDERFRMAVTTPERDAVLAHKYFKECRRMDRPVDTLLNPNSMCNVGEKFLVALRERFKDKSIYHQTDRRNAFSTLKDVESWRAQMKPLENFVSEQRIYDRVGRNRTAFTAPKTSQSVALRSTISAGKSKMTESQKPAVKPKYAELPQYEKPVVDYKYLPQNVDKQIFKARRKLKSLVEKPDKVLNNGQRDFCTEVLRLERESDQIMKDFGVNDRKKAEIQATLEAE